MVEKALMLAVLLVTCGGCAARTMPVMTQPPYDPASFETADEVSGEIARCEATGKSSQDCYDSHFLAPPPPTPVSVVLGDVALSAIETLRVAHHLARHEAHTR
jgi:hypothetical protein